MNTQHTKLYIMQKNIYWLLLVAFLVASCGNAKKDQNAELNDKKAKLEKLKGEQKSVNDEIAKLEAEIAKLDTSAKVEKAKLVEVMPIHTDNFSHFIELQGKIDGEIWSRD